MDESIAGERSNIAGFESGNPHGLRMRKLLRSRVTKAFLSTEGRWTEDMSHALEVSGSSESARAVRGINPTELEIYYSFDERCPSQWDFALPLH